MINLHFALEVSEADIDRVNACLASKWLLYNQYINDGLQKKKPCFDRRAKDHRVPFFLFLSCQRLDVITSCTTLSRRVDLHVSGFTAKNRTTKQETFTRRWEDCGPATCYLLPAGWNCTPSSQTADTDTHAELEIQCIKGSVGYTPGYCILFYLYYRPER